MVDAFSFRAAESVDPEGLGSKSDANCGQVRPAPGAGKFTGRIGTLYPAIDANISAAREKISGAVFGQPDVDISPFTLYNASVNVSYTLDIFGGIRRGLESLQALVDYQGFQAQAAYLALTANIVTAAVKEASFSCPNPNDAGDPGCPGNRTPSGQAAT